MLRATAVVLAVGASAATLHLLLGDEGWAGDTVWTVSSTQGFHRGDVAVLVAWLACLLLASLLWDLGRRQDGRHRR